MSVELRKCFDNVKDSVNAATGHYQLWFTLRGKNKALENYYDEMNDARYVDFFKALNIGHYKLMFVETACIFDSDPRTDSIRKLKTLLTKNHLRALRTEFEIKLKPYSKLVSNIKSIRNKIIAHKDSAVDPRDLYKKHRIKPNQIRDLLNETAKLMRKLEQHLNGNSSSSSVGETDRWESATFELLKVLRSAKGS